MYIYIPVEGASRRCAFQLTATETLSYAECKRQLSASVYRVNKLPQQQHPVSNTRYLVEQLAPFLSTCDMHMHHTWSDRSTANMLKTTTSCTILRCTFQLSIVILTEVMAMVRIFSVACPNEDAAG